MMKNTILWLNYSSSYTSIALLHLSIYVICTINLITALSIYFISRLIYLYTITYFSIYLICIVNDSISTYILDMLVIALVFLLSLL